VEPYGLPPAHVLTVVWSLLDAPTKWSAAGVSQSKPLLPTEETTMRIEKDFRQANVSDHLDNCDFVKFTKRSKKESTR
jgi:hypothetical protein